MNTYAGKVVLITGGSSGIGKAAALAFARAGATVAIASRNASRGQAVLEELEAFHHPALYIPSDVSQSHQVHNLIRKVIDTYGRLDCAFNNAASLEEPFARTADFTEEQFHRSIDLNLKSVWLCMKEEITQMLSQDPRGGVIVNTSSVNGLGGVASASLYAAAKAGIIALTKSAALEYGRDGIRINALVAGSFDTPLLASAIQRATNNDPAARKFVVSRYKESIALGRIGDPQEAAQAVLWLCSESASYVTGHSMIVDGGWSASMR